MEPSEDDSPSLENLKRESMYFRAMLDLAPDSIYFKDTEGRIQAISEWGARFFGHKSRHDMEGKSDYDFFPKEMADEYFADEKRLMDSGSRSLTSGRRKHLPMAGRSAFPRPSCRCTTRRAS